MNDLDSAVEALQNSLATDSALDAAVVGESEGAANAGGVSVTSIAEFQTPFKAPEEPAASEGAAEGAGAGTAGGEGEGSDAATTTTTEAAGDAGAGAGAGAAGQGTGEGTGTENEAPELVVHPRAQIPEAFRKQFRIRGGNETDTLALQIKAQNQNMTLEDAIAQARQQLGVSVTTAGEQQQSQQAQATDPLQALNDQIAALQAERDDLNPGIDHVEFKRITRELEGLMGRRAEAVAESRVQKAFQEREALVVAEQQADAAFAAAKARFPDLQDEGSEFTQRFAEIHNGFLDSQSPLLGHKDYEMTVGAMVAGEFLAANKTFAFVQPGSTASPAAQGGGAGTGTTPAGQAQKGTQQNPTPGTASPAGGGVALIPGARTTPTVEHRVTVQQPDPERENLKQLQTAAEADDLLSVGKLLGSSNGGVIAPKSRAFSLAGA